MTTIVAIDPPRRAGSHYRPRSPWWGALTCLVALTVAVSVAVRWQPGAISPSSADVKFIASVRKVGPVAVSAVRTSGVWTAGLDPQVRIRLTNRNVSPIRAQVWWFLAGTDDRQPWARPVAASAYVSTSLQANQTREAIVPVDPASVVSGTYRLTVWVHAGSPTQDPASYPHSDGGPLDGLIQVQPASPTIERRFPPASPVHITSCLSTAGNAGRLVADVTNSGAQAAVIESWVYLAAPDNNYPWRDKRQARSETETTSIDAGATARLAFRLPPPLAKGAVPSIWVHALDANGASVHLDGVWCVPPLT